MRAGLAVVLAMTWASCYTPTPAPGQACSEKDRCPEGQECDLSSLTCLDEIPPAARFSSIDSGADHTCGIDAAGALWCWGGNARGQLGLGFTSELATTPVRIGADTWSTVSAGDFSTCGIKTDRSAWCWGGVSGIPGHNSPFQVATGAAAVSTGPYGQCILLERGELQCSFDGNPLTTEQLPSGMVTIAVSDGTKCFIDGERRLWCYGVNEQGGTGQPGPSPVTTPTQVISGKTWASVALGLNYGCAIDTEDHLWCWGACSQGQTSVQGPNEGCVPAQVDGTYRAVGSYESTTCAVRSDGALACFGANAHGQLAGRGDDSENYTIAVSQDFSAWQAIAVGGDHACGLRDGGEAWCWGSDASGQLGGGSGGPGELTPIEIDDGDWASISLGKRTSCGIRSDGTLWCWGMNAYGQLGDGSTVLRSRPRRIGDADDWLAVSPGRYHTCGLRRPGALWCWGHGRKYGTGTGALDDLLTPTPIGTRTDWTAISAGVDETCALAGTELDCWGDAKDERPERVGSSERWAVVSINHRGFGPKGTITAVTTTRQLFGFHDSNLGLALMGSWDTFSNGNDHGCGLLGGVAACFGTNNSGQLGNNMQTGTSNMPVSVLGGQTWSTIAAGDEVTCGVTTASDLYCWGDHAVIGQPKDAMNALVPLPLLPGRHWKTVSLGEDHGCAIEDTGHLWCWGARDFGMLGDGAADGDRPRRVRAPE